MADIRMLRVTDVTAITGLSRTRIYELEHLDQFPRRRKLSARAVAWRSDEIAAWIDSRAHARSAATA